MRINLTTPMSDDKESKRRNEVILAAIEQYTEERMSDDHTASSQPTQSDALLDAEGVKLYWYRQGKDDGVEHERTKIVAWLREQDGHGYDAMRADCIEAGEHLK